MSVKLPEVQAQIKAQLAVPWSPKSPGSPSSSIRDAPGAFPASPSLEPISQPFSGPQSLNAAIKARKEDYVRKRSIKIKVGTWNVASVSGTDKDLGAWFVEGLGVKGLSQDLSGLSVDNETGPSQNSPIESVEDQEARMTAKKSTVPKNDEPAVAHGGEIGLYVLGLQEVVDINSVTEAVRPYTDPNPAKKWKHAMKRALPAGYEKIAEQQLLGLLMLIYASPEVAPSISSVSATSVGTGLMGYLGNKGAVSVRLVIAETTRLCFVNCHLAAGADQTALSRRIWDTNQILSRTKFSPISLDGELLEGPEEKIGDEDFAFWFGDLNYRLDDIPGEDVRRLLLLHTRNEYDSENKSKRKIDSELGYIAAPSNESLEPSHYEDKDLESPATESAIEPKLDPRLDPASLHTTLQSLLPHDQLRTMQKTRKAFHDGWREGDINFLPTYKYDVGSVGMFDSGEKKRSPSWCDRILFRTRKDFERYSTIAKQEEVARKKDEEMKKRGIDEATAEQDVLFDYDPDTDGLVYGDDYDEEEDAIHDAELIQTREGFEDSIELDHYISHQRILSSDHKPLEAMFSLTYDGVVPELKAKVHQEVARDLDKAENEGRPAVTVIMESTFEDANSDNDDHADPPDMSCVQFGDVRFKVKKSRHITIANTGQIEATFSFIDRSAAPGQQANITPPWLSLSQLIIERHPGEPTHTPLEKENLLSPGDTITIVMTLEVSDPDLAYELNKSRTKLSDVLVLRITNGRDYFIPVKGKWMPSCFGRTLNELVLVPQGGVRKLPRSPKNRDSTGSALLKSSPSQHSAPKELFALMEAISGLIERSMADWEMVHQEEIPPWQHKGVGDSWPFDAKTWTLKEGENRETMLESIREALDNASPLENQFQPDISFLSRLEVLSETMILFLHSLRDGIITNDSWASIDDKLSTVDASKKSLTPTDIQEIVMDSLSNEPVHSVCLTFLTFMLTRIVQDRTSDSTAQTPSTATKRTRASTMSSDAGTESTTASSEESSHKRRFFSLRRMHAPTSAISAGDDDSIGGVTERKKAIMNSYIDIFAPIMIRSALDGHAKSKERKHQEEKKKKVLRAMLEVTPG